MKWKEWTSLILDISPFGEVKAVFELFSGKDLITQEDLNLFDKVTCAISLVPIAGWIGKVQKVSKNIKYLVECKKFLCLLKLANKANDVLDKFNWLKQAYEMATPIPCGFKIDPEIKEDPIAFKKFEKYGFMKSDTFFNYEIFFKDNPIFAKIMSETFMNYHLQNNNRKSVDELAAEVIHGDWGVGQDRKNRLKAAGYNYQEVQDEVNRRYRKK